ncbi:hypothetical protein E3N88_38974 [Mikania micrantha]|uniref:Phospholipid scramblase n=1 Tax=Mikania micrantha TaxID=192012 RepID=A0A5N6LVN8_9ASTR|nr:hypothetical protein E3N88_38974 [Mikania micrantha]
MKKQQNDGLYTYKILLCKKFGLVKADITENLVSGRKLHWRSYRLCGFGANLCSRNNPANLSRKFEHAVHTGPEFSRDFLVQLWVADGATQSIEYASPEEALIAHLLSRSNLIITRDIEWANLTLGFEQVKTSIIIHHKLKYVIFLFIILLRNRRPFVATITDAYGNEMFKVRMAFWWITSSIYAEVGGKGINGEVLAEINRDWRGFGFEVFTDAGQYVIRFGSASGMLVELSKNVEEFDVARPLILLERAVTVALAVSLDNDYFSRHGGWGVPFFVAAE